MGTEQAQEEQSGRFPSSIGEREELSGRREQILLASWEALSQVGFEKITTRRIAEAAGINIATLHYHFGSKEAVLTETLRYAQRWTDRQMRLAIADSRTSEEALELAFIHTLKLLFRMRGVLRFDLVVRAFRDADAKQEALAVYSAYRRFVEEIIERHIADGGSLASDMTVWTMADYIVTVVDGVILHHTLSGDDVAAERNLGLVKQQVFQLMGIPRNAETGTK